MIYLTHGNYCYNSLALLDDYDIDSEKIIDILEKSHDYLSKI